MSNNYKSFKNAIALTMLMFIGSTLAFGQAILKHSYTFEEGTYEGNTLYDQAGTLNGTISGSGVISDGIFTTVSDEDIITFDGATLALNTYSAITMEASVTAGDNANPGWTIMAYFGEASGSNAFWLAIARDNNLASAVYNGTSADTPENGELEDGRLHHLVAILTETYISFYIDGRLIEQTAQETPIASLETTYAQLLRPAGWGDPAWKGSYHEFNLYEGVMDEETIKQHATDFLGEDFFNATLSDLSSIEGTIEPAFDPETDVYQITVPYGTPYITLTAEPTIPGAQVKVSDGLGIEVGKDGTIDLGPDGIDLQIVVIALNGIAKSTYYVQIVTGPENETPILKDIQLSAGGLLETFNPTVTDYMATIPIGATSVEVTPVKASASQTISGGGTVTLTDGKGSTSITVTSGNSSNTMTYNINFFNTRPVVNEDYYIVHEVSGYVLSGDLTAEPKITLPLTDEASQVWQFEESGVEDQYFLKNKENNYMAVGVSSDHWHYVIRNTLPSDLDSARFKLFEFRPGSFKVITVKRTQAESGPEKNMMSTNDANLNSIVYNDKWIGSSWDNDSMTVWNILPPAEVVDPYNTYLDTLYVDGKSINPQFVYSIYDYTIVLPTDVTSIDISAVAKDEAATTITGTGTVNTPDNHGSFTITVTANDDPSYSHEYVINYVKETPLTLTHSYTFADGTAKDVVGGADGAIQGGSIVDGVFTSSEEGDYIVLPSGDIALNTYPAITMETWMIQDTNSGYSMFAYFGGLSGANSLWMQLSRADDGDPANVSRLELNTGTATDVDGEEPSPGDTIYYVAVITYDSIAFYQDNTLIGVTKTDPTASIAQIDTANGWLCYGGWSDPTWLGSIFEFNIYTGAMDPSTINTNYLAGIPTEDATSIATLSTLTFNNDTVDDFASYTFDYHVVLPKGTTDVPTVAGIAMNPNASVEVTDADALPGTATIEVTSEDNNNTNTYTINFTIDVSKDATLSDLTVDGTTISGFDPEVLDYEMTLEAGTSLVPTVLGTSTDANAAIEVTPAAQLPGTTTVAVTAEDNETIITYSVEFKLDVSTDATLSDLTVNGTTIDEFSPDKINYIVLLPQGSAVPTVVGTPNFSGAEVVVTDASSIPGSTTIKVTAEDEQAEKTYTVNFDFQEAVGLNKTSVAKVYPSVTNNSFVVETAGTAHTISVYNITGVLINHQLNSNELTTIHLKEQGMYFVKVESNGIINTFRIIRIN